MGLHRLPESLEKLLPADLQVIRDFYFKTVEKEIKDE